MTNTTTELTVEAAQHCNSCNRVGQLVAQFVNPASPAAGFKEPWVFRFYLCRYHRSSESRRNANASVKLPTKVIQYRSDDELLRA